MKLKHVFLILAITLVNIGFANAEELTSSCQQSVRAKPILEEESSIVLTSETENNLEHKLVPTLLDTCYYDSGSLNLSFQFNDQPDSTDFSLIECYIKHVMPIEKSVDSKKVDLLEIL